MAMTDRFIEDLYWEDADAISCDVHCPACSWPREALLHSAAAETSRERVALSLSGPDCSSQRLSIVAALAQIRGVESRRSGKRA